MRSQSGQSDRSDMEVLPDYGIRWHWLWYLQERNYRLLLPKELLEERREMLRELRERELHG